MRVIRPFVYVREYECREFSRVIHLPIIDENCPGCFEGPKARYRMKTLLAQQEHQVPTLFGNLLRAMKPIMMREPFDCRYCDQRFRFEVNQLEHEQMHDGYTPRCEECPQTTETGTSSAPAADDAQDSSVSAGLAALMDDDCAT